MGQKMVQEHIGNNSGVLAVTGHPQALGSPAHHGVLVGIRIDGSVQANAGLYGRWVAFELAAGHRVGDEVAHHQVGVGGRGRVRAGQVKVSQEIHAVSLKLKGESYLARSNPPTHGPYHLGDAGCVTLHL